MGRDDMQLSGWRPEGDRWVDVGENTYRPERLRAEFFVGSDLHVEVEARGDADGVQVVHTSHRRFATVEEREATLAKVENPKDHRARLDAWSAPLRPEDVARFDPNAATGVLERTAVVRYQFDDAGRPERIAVGDGPLLAVQDVRRWLAGPEGPPAPGPKAKATLEQVAKLWRAATKKKRPAARAVAEGLDVSISTAHRYIAAARKAGLIDSEA
jgi:hypothetical protein